MNKGKRIGIVLVGWVALGALAAPGQFGNRVRPRPGDGTAECGARGAVRSVHETQGRRLQQVLCDGACGRQMRRGLWGPGWGL